MNKHIEFSKIIIAAVGITYFIAFAIGAKVVLSGTHEGLQAFFAFVGSATSIALTAYSYKAKAENVKKIEIMGIDGVREEDDEEREVQYEGTD